VTGIRILPGDPVFKDFGAVPLLGVPLIRLLLISPLDDLGDPPAPTPILILGLGLPSRLEAEDPPSSSLLLVKFVMIGPLLSVELFLLSLLCEDELLLLLSSSSLEDEPRFSSRFFLSSLMVDEGFFDLGPIILDFGPMEEEGSLGFDFFSSGESSPCLSDMCFFFASIDIKMDPHL